MPKKDVRLPREPAVTYFHERLYAQAKQSAAINDTSVTRYIMQGVQLLGWIENENIWPSSLHLMTGDAPTPFPLPYQLLAEPALKKVQLDLSPRDRTALQTLSEQTDHSMSYLLREGARLREMIHQLLGPCASFDMENVESDRSYHVFL